MSRPRNPNDLIRIEDAIKVLCRKICHPGIACPDIYCKEMWDEFEDVERVEVVRCKDCKHYQFADNRAFGFPVKRCEWTGFEDVDDEDFCSRGEQKDGDNNG